MSATGGTPGTPRVLRAMNDRAALELLVSHGPLTRTQIGELTGLSKPTASQLLGRLAAAGLVRTTGNVTGRPGPSAQLYEVNPAAAYVAALSVDPAGVTAVVADIAGRTVGEQRVAAGAVDDGGDEGHGGDGATARLVTAAVDGALEKGGWTGARCTGSSSGRRARSTRVPVSCGTRRICPAGTRGRCSASWGTRWAPRS